MSQERINDDDGVIACLPDLQVEVSQYEDMLILQQTDHSGGVERVAVHRWHVRMLAEQFDLLPGVSTAEADALRRVATLERRLRLLHSRIAQLDEWLAKQVDYDSADINLEVNFSGATFDLAEEFLHDLGGASAGPPTAPIRHLGLSVQPGQSPEQVAMAGFRDFVRQNKPLLSLVASWGDGQCGALLQVLQGELLGQAAPAPQVAKSRAHDTKAAAIDSAGPAGRPGSQAQLTLNDRPPAEKTERA